MHFADLLEHHDGRLLQKWSHYPPIYDRHLAPYRGRQVTLLEIGVAHGGSLQLWRTYFGGLARIYGIDVDPRCSQLHAEGGTILIGSQADRAFLDSVRASLGTLDVVIDDGGHTMKQQRITFETLFPHVSPGGIYLCEDTHTSYWPEYGGGYRRRGTFIEFAKSLVDDQHAWHSRQKSFQPSELTALVGGIHFYDSLIAIERAQRSIPRVVTRGTERLAGEEYSPPRVPFLRWLLLAGLERVCRAFRLPSIRD